MTFDDLSRNKVIAMCDISRGVCVCVGGGGADSQTTVPVTHPVLFWCHSVPIYLFICLFNLQGWKQYQIEHAMHTFKTYKCIIKWYWLQHKYIKQHN